MKTNVARWREKHDPFMTKDATVRHAARLHVQSHILVEESVKTTSEKNNSDCMILNKMLSTNYRKFWDGCESDTASEDFAELHGVQAGEHDSSDDGGEAVEVVACKDNVPTRNSKGKKTRTETRDGDERDTKSRGRIHEMFVLLVWKLIFRQCTRQHSCVFVLSGWIPKHVREQAVANPLWVFFFLFFPQTA